MRALAACALASFFIAATPQPVALPTAAPTPDVPLYSGEPATRFALDVRPLGFDADGDARVLLVTRFYDARGHVTRLLANSDVDWRASSGRVRWQTRMRFGQPAAIVSSDLPGPMRITVHVDKPELGTQTLAVDPETWLEPRVVATALGARSAHVGWYPQTRGTTRIERIDDSGKRVALATLAGPSSTYVDTTARPGEHYRYAVTRNREMPVTTAAVVMRDDPPATSIANVSGTGMWFFFTTNPLDAIDYRHLDPRAIVARAVDAHLRYVELRTSYGAYDEIEPQARPVIDAIVDGLAAHGIATIAWTVPRSTDSDDLARSIAAAYYHTARGTRFAGLALDLERGEEFMNDTTRGAASLARYVANVREALGPKYLIVSTIEDPFVEHLTRKDYPYEAIARESTVLQPMTYWRVVRGATTTPRDVRAILKASYAALVRESGRTMPVSVGGQTGTQGDSGYAMPDEIDASLRTAASLGAIGECFFDWDTTQPWQWAALHGYAKYGPHEH